MRWWQARVTRALELGADGFMQDFGEQVVDDMHFADGSTGQTMHNRLPVLYHRATMAAVRDFERAHPRRKLFYFTRTGYSGSPGSARDEYANFPGDETTDWTHTAGLASQTTDMLNRAIGGAYGFTTDIGGFFDVGPYQPTTKELFLRWAEWAALSPMFRLHGSVAAGTHTPWSYDHETVSAYAQLTRLHLRARDLILRLWERAERTGMPITRPLWLAYPGDRTAAAQDQEWLLGPKVLVAPVVEQGATGRDVYFPRGCWRDPQTGVRVRGPDLAPDRRPTRPARVLLPVRNPPVRSTRVPRGAIGAALTQPELSFRGVVARAARTLVEHRRTLLITGLIVFIPVGLLEVVDANVQEPLQDADAEFDASLIAALIAAAAGHAVGALLGEVVYAGIVSSMVLADRGGRPDSIRDILRHLPIWRLIAVDLLWILTVVVGFAFLIVPGFVFMVWFALVAPAVEVEERGVLAAFRRSFELVRKRFWLVCGLIVPVIVLGEVLASAGESISIAGLGHGWLADWIAAVVADLISSPPYALVAVILFLGLRERYPRSAQTASV